MHRDREQSENLGVDSSRWWKCSIKLAVYTTRRYEKWRAYPRSSGLGFLGALFACSDQSKLLTSLNILITGKDRAEEVQARCMPKYIVCFILSNRTYYMKHLFYRKNELRFFSAENKYTIIQFFLTEVIFNDQ
jgi:hypothetical protein